MAAFERESGITVNLRSDDEDVLADQIVTEGSHSPADVFYTENSPPLQYLASKGLLAPVDPSTLANTPSRYNSPDGQWVGVSARVSVMVYNTSLLKADQLPTSVMELADPKWSGRIAHRRERDGLPADRDHHRPDLRRGGGAALARGGQGERREPRLPEQRDRHVRGQPRAGRAGHHQPVLLVPRAGRRSGPGGLHSAIAYFAPHDVGYVVDVSGAGILKSSTHQQEAQRFLAFLTSAQGQEIIAHSDSFEYPIASGVTTAQPETPFDQLQPNGITIAELGTGAEAIKLLQEAQLL